MPCKTSLAAVLNSLTSQASAISSITRVWPMTSSVSATALKTICPSAVPNHEITLSCWGVTRQRGAQATGGFPAFTSYLLLVGFTVAISLLPHKWVKSRN